jgi:H+/Cl- antiporter ClcA
MLHAAPTAEDRRMTKSSITRLFIGSIVAVVAAIEGNDVIGINGGSAAWTTLGIIVIAGLAVVGGAIGGLVAWIGALLNTSRLDDKTWFILLLVLGLFSFGFVAMVAYVVAGPDATNPGPARPGVATTPGA